MSKRFLIKHVGNLGDCIFFVSPILETLKRRFPECHISVITAWGFRVTHRRIHSPLQKTVHWGERNQSGFCLAALQHNPHIDKLIHWHDTKLSLEGELCHEGGQHFPTWSANYYNQQKQSGNYDAVYELDCGVPPDANPLQFLYRQIGLEGETYSNYKIYCCEQDQRIGRAVVATLPRPRIVLLEGLEGSTTRGWDPGKIPALERAIHNQYGVKPIWFGGNHIPYYHGRPLSLLENVAQLFECDAAIGVLSGPLHLAAATGLPTITLYGDIPIERTAPAYFLNSYSSDPTKHHRTLLGPANAKATYLKPTQTDYNLTPAEVAEQHFVSWQSPGRQATKSCVSVLTVDEIMTVLGDTIPK